MNRHEIDATLLGNVADARLIPIALKNKNNLKSGGSIGKGVVQFGSLEA